jgi:hypothetical protein
MRGVSQTMFPMGVWVEAKPPHPSAGEMTNLMKQFEKQLRRRELTPLINAEAEKTPHENSRGGRGALRRQSPGWPLRALIDDLQRFFDFCVARYIVWRETPKDWKRARSGKQEQG